MARGQLLVVGASGVIGRSVIELAVDSAAWDVFSLSRREPYDLRVPHHRHLALDLADAQACSAQLKPLADRLDAVVYAAVDESPGLVSGWTDRTLMLKNRALLEHVMEPLRGTRTQLRVILMQGTKAYGAHLHPIKLPARENDPRDAHENFYWLQEDYVREICGIEGWSWTILRPQVVFGGAIGVSMNPIPVIGAYLALCRDRGISCGYPGEHTGIWEAADARLIAEACLWALATPHTRNEIYNVANGDVWVPEHRWDEICDAVGVMTGSRRAIDFARFPDEQADSWRQLASRYGLREPDLGRFCGQSHHYLNLLMCYGRSGAPYPPALVSTIKISQAGFNPRLDTLESIRYWLAYLQRHRFLPGFGALHADSTP
jgi:nucleoside-diphosphate-sugar epimerase